MAEQAILAGFKGSDATVGVTGSVRIAEPGTPYIVGVGLYDDTRQTNLGYIGEDGVNEDRDESKAEWTPWQENSPIREDITSSKVTFKFTLWQINGVTIAYYYGIDGSKIVTNPDGSWQFDEGGKPNIPTKQMYIDVLDKGRILRMVLSAAQISERGSIVYKSDEIIGFETTVTATPGPEGWSVRRIFLGYDLAGLATPSIPKAPTMKAVTVLDDGEDFTLKFGSQTTAALDGALTTADDLEEALEALSSIGAGKVAVTGVTGGPFTVVLDGSLVGELTAGTNCAVATPA